MLDPTQWKVCVCVGMCVMEEFCGRVVVSWCVVVVYTNRIKTIMLSWVLGNCGTKHLPSRSGKPVSPQRSVCVWGVWPIVTI